VRDAAEREAGEIVSAAVHEERAAQDKAHLLLQRLLEHRIVGDAATAVAGADLVIVATPQSAYGAVGKAIGVIGENRTLGYAKYGMAGMLTLFIRGMLCNWMVSTGVVGAMISTTVSGKVIAMWMPIMVFFYMTFEHSVVNMFLFPSGLLLGGNFSIMDYLIWNEIPTVLGNLAGGLAFTGLTLYATHVKTAPKRAFN